MRNRLTEIAIIGALLAICACATVPNNNYVICNDLDANVTCPDNTANIVIGM